jgi:hypothetical protein
MRETQHHHFNDNIKAISHVVAHSAKRESREIFHSFGGDDREAAVLFIGKFI